MKTQDKERLQSAVTELVATLDAFAEGCTEIGEHNYAARFRLLQDDAKSIAEKLKREEVSQ